MFGLVESDGLAGLVSSRSHIIVKPQTTVSESFCFRNLAKRFILSVLSAFFVCVW